MNNQKIAATLEQLADLLEFQGTNAFKLRAYRNSARVIRDLSEPLTAIVDDPKRKLTDLDGVGKSIAEKCTVLIETGNLPQLEKVKAEVPESVLALLRIPNLGPKKAAVLFKELGITTLEDLKSACEEGRVAALKGFAKKTEQIILDGIEIAAAANERIYWRDADELVAELRAHFEKCDAIKKMEFAGSYRRGKETIGDLDILVVSDDDAAVMDHFNDFHDVKDVLVRGETKMSVRLSTEFQIDLRVVPSESFGAALQYFTGSKEHNVKVRGLAKQMGLKVNEWGVYKTEDDSYVCGESEEEVYAAIDLPWFPPEMRENRYEFDALESGDLPELIELSHMKGDLHMHTTYSDGRATIDEMIAAAKKLNLKFIAITDHSKRVAMANGLDEVRLLEQWSTVDEANEAAGKSFTVLKGIECDILEKGGMDLSDEVLAQADWVLGAIHYGQNQSSAEITKRLLGAIENPHVDAIAHPTGRQINKREPYEFDVQEVFAAVKEHGKFLELNAHPVRLDLNEVHCGTAKQMGIPIVINTDAHSTNGLEVMRYGILQARRAGLEKSDIVNTKTWTQIKKMIDKRSS